MTQYCPDHAKHACGSRIKNLKPDTEYEIRFIPLDCASRPLLEKVTSINVCTEKSFFKPTDIEVNQKTIDGAPAVDIRWKPEEGTGY